MRKTFSLPVAATAAGGGTPPPPPADTVDNIEHSVRFDSAYLSRTPSSTGNVRKWTWSGWIKQSSLSTGYQPLFVSGTSGAMEGLYIYNNQLDVYLNNSWVLQSDPVLRDPSAWMHIVLAVDTDATTAPERVKLYINGVQTGNPSAAQNINTLINNSSYEHRIGSHIASGLDFGGYLANVHFVDGYQKAPTDFAFTDSDNVWQPKAYTGSYGTNGFHLDFADTSSATALGNDVSGNNNDFTANNLVAGPAYTANSFSTEFDGNGDYLSIPDSTDLDLGSGDFTIEAWIYSDSANTLGTIIGKRTSYGQHSPFILRNTSTTSLQLLMSNTAGDAFALSETAASVITSNTWHHVAVTRNGSAIKAYLDGTEVISSTFSTAVYQNTEPVVIGSAVDNHHWNGKISNLRMIKGRALYTAAFTPPSTALTATDDTVLLTCQDATVRDNSNIGHDVTASGDVAVVNQGPFNGYSGSFDGTGDYLSVPANTVFDIGATKTWELWFKLDTVSNTKIYAGSLNNYWFNTGYTAMGGVANKIGFSAYTGSGWDAINSTTSLVAGSWYHVAATWDGTYFKLYLNGVLEATSSDLSARTWASNNGYAYEIGGISSQSTTTIDGLISNHRVTDSVLYTADFTPPTADLTTTSQGATASNVKLLTCQDSTFIDNSPSAHSITAAGNASTISVNPHTDKYSVTFDGDGDGLSISANTEFDIGSAKTWECWFKLNTVSANKVLAGSFFNYWLNVSYTGIGGATDKVGFSLYDGSNWNAVNSTTSIAAGSWYHVAATWDGTYAKLYLNGVLEATSADWSAKTWASNNGNDYNIGALSTAATTSIDGLISNHRVTDSVLYTSNFLPSKEDLTTTSQGATASNVKLLTCQSYKIQDNSPSAHTITVNGDAAPSTDAPFVTSGAGSFDGTGDYLSIADDADFDLGSGDFTIEGWFNIQSGNTRGAGWVSQWTSGLAWYFGTTDPSSVANKFVFGYSFDGSATGILDSGYVVTNSLNQWVHYAVSKSGTDVRLFVNGTQQGSTGTLSGTIYNSSDNIVIGLNGSGGSGWYFNGHMSNLRISKGLARYTSNFTPPTEDFDPTDQDTVLLALQDNTLDDLSGNDHAVTANGDAATSTVSPFEPVDGSDAMLDSPTNYGSGDTVRGNFCTWNPVHKNANASLSNGNLDYLATGGYPNGAVGTMAVSSGKWYFETICTANPYTPPVYYAAVVNTETFNLPSSGYVATTGFYAYSLREGGTYTDGSFTASGWSTGAVNDVIGVALDLDAGTVTFYKNNTLLGTLSGLSGSFAPFTASDTAASGGAGSTNFGQQPFKYPVAGYKAWCSTNLPTPAVADGSTAMDVVTYTGTSSGAVVSTPNMSPDVVWIKDRGNTFNHQLFDTIRGVNSSLLPNLTFAENNYNSFTSFDSTGFTVPNVNGTGANGNNHVAWTWDAGSSTVSNTDGTITSQVRANPTAGISVVSYVGTGSAGTVGHGLSNTPKMYIVKSRDTSFAQDWRTYHSGINDPSKYLQLHSTTESTTGTTTWNSTDPTSSIFNLGSGSTINTLNDNYIAYVFAPVEGFSAFGSFTGSTSNTFVYTGMRPRWLMIKRTDTTGNWQILDTEREGYNVDNDPLWANLATQEGTTDIADILSNGFKMRDGATGTYIYAAFAEHPFKTSRAR